MQLHACNEELKFRSIQRSCETDNISYSHQNKNIL